MTFGVLAAYAGVRHGKGLNSDQIINVLATITLIELMLSIGLSSMFISTPEDANLRLCDSRESVSSPLRIRERLRAHAM